MKIVYIIGVSNHDYQIEPCGEFKDFLEATCERNDIHTIAEEMNMEGLIQRSAELTVAQCISSSKQPPLQHLLCDPDMQERKKWGIENPPDVIVKALIANLQQEETERLAQHEYRKRELFWLLKSFALTSFPDLFICGGMHVVPFSQLLNWAGFETKVLEESWTPNQTWEGVDHGD
jgi:hypothetical protein